MGTRMTKQHTAPGGLTQRQAEIADAMIQFGTAKLVARALGISPHTVENTMGTIKQRLDTPNPILTAVKWDRLRRGAA
jgi:DNA-binding CsgD family transcriptional regulator